MEKDDVADDPLGAAAFDFRSSLLNNFNFPEEPDIMTSSFPRRTRYFVKPCVGTISPPLRSTRHAVAPPLIAFNFMAWEWMTGRDEGGGRIIVEEWKTFFDVVYGGRET